MLDFWFSGVWFGFFFQVNKTPHNPAPPVKGKLCLPELSGGGRNEDI